MRNTIISCIVNETTAVISLFNNNGTKLNEIPFKVISDSQRMSFKKKGRNGAFINICKKLGQEVPHYDVSYLRKPTLHDWFDYVKEKQIYFKYTNLYIYRLKRKEYEGIGNNNSNKYH